MGDTIIDQAINYLQGKQCTNGGFCFYKMEFLEEANVRDTFFAVSSFLTLGKEIPQREQIKTYLWEVVNKNNAFHNLYFPLLTLKRMEELQLNGQLQAIIANFSLALPKQTNSPEYQGESLQGLMRNIKLKNLLGKIPQRQEIIDFIFSQQQENGGFGKNPNLEDTYWSLAILKELDYDFQGMETTRNLIQRLQVKETGFTNTLTGISTSLDTLYAGIFACQILGEKIYYPDAIVKFVKMCQMAKGGFARMPTGLPDLENTYRALKILKF